MNGYKLIGVDGWEYGPVTADQIRQWIRERRVERQTPVLPPDAREWTTAGALPEFAGDFSGGDPMGATPIRPPQFAAIIPAPARPSNSMAKAALACGVLAVTVGCCCGGIPFNFLGLVFSIIALVQTGDNPQKHTGRGMAIVGLVLSILSFAMAALAVVLK